MLLPERRFFSPPLKNVSLEEGFWKIRFEINALITLYSVYYRLKETGRIDAFKLTWNPDNKTCPKPHYFWDSDVAKWVEAAAYSLSLYDDPKLRSLLEEVVKLIINAQQPDGYLNVYFTVVEPGKRWTNLRDKHELYCAGHLIEAAVALKENLNDSTLLKAIEKYVELIDKTFGREKHKIHGYPGHQEIELALIRLYHLTHNEKYLKLAEYFINEKGKEPYYFDIEARKRGESIPDRTHLFRGEVPRPVDPPHFQAHLPAREQEEAVGHAVRACYFYSAMADLAMELHDKELMKACQSLWQDIAYKKLYVHGGIGSSSINEGFTYPFHLPNKTAYAETCAAIAWFFFNYRMLCNYLNGKYADMMEHSLYNAILPGVSLIGNQFFYTNPLEVDSSQRYHFLMSPSEFRERRRKKFFTCSCCPPNIARLLASLVKYIYSIKEEDDPQININLYISSKIRFFPHNHQVELIQKSNHPWEGKISIRIFPDIPEEEFIIALRIPGWVSHFQLLLNSKKIYDGAYESFPSESSSHDSKGEGKKGKDSELLMQKRKHYILLKKKWKKQDFLELFFPIIVKAYHAHPHITENQGKIALFRGPILYCLEENDNPIPFNQVYIKSDAIQEIKYNDPDFPKEFLNIQLEGSEDLHDPLFSPKSEDLIRRFMKKLVCLKLKGYTSSLEDDNHSLFPLYSSRTSFIPVELLAIPYFAWANRKEGGMVVWIRESCSSNLL